MLHEQADTELWLVLRNELWFVGFMSLYAIWITHLAGWAAETPVEHEDDEALGFPPATRRPYYERRLGGRRAVTVSSGILSVALTEAEREKYVGGRSTNPVDADELTEIAVGLHRDRLAPIAAEGRSPPCVTPFTPFKGSKDSGASFFGVAIPLDL
jgi:hypothetical protein